MSTIQHKRGASFAASGRFTGDGGQTLAGCTVTSQIRTAAGGLVCTLAVAVAADGLSFTAVAPDTSSWPAPARLLWDVRIEGAGAVVLTETVELDVVPEVTRG